MPLWSIEDWRARIGSCWCALGRPFNTRFTRNRGKSRRVLTLRQLLTTVIMMMLLVVANLVLCVIWLKMSLTQVVVTVSFSGIFFMFKKIIQNFENSNCIPECELPHGSLKLSFVVVVVVGAQLFVTISISRAVIFLLLMTSGDVERNPGPEQSLTESILKTIGNRVTLSMMMVILLLEAMAAVQTYLLIRSGDVETNPGPGRYGDLDYDNVDSSTILSEDNFHDVYQKVVPSTSSRYFEFGIALGLPPAELDSIKEESKSSRALSGVLQAWLKQNYNTEIHGPPTWRKLVEAVDSSAGGNNHALAKTIAFEHPYIDKRVDDTCTSQQKANDSHVLTDSQQNVDSDIQPASDKDIAEAKVETQCASNSSADTLLFKDDGDKIGSKDSMTDGVMTASAQKKRMGHPFQHFADSQQDEPNNGEDGAKIEPQHTTLPLKAKDVENFFKMKREHYRVWKTIGTELGIDVDTLNAIKKDYTNDTDRLRAVIDSANPAPTYKTMAKVLQSAHITNTIAALPDLKWQHYRIWRILGTELGIGVEMLNSIEKNYRNNNDRLHAMMDSANPPLTPEVITKVLQSERISNAVEAILDDQEINEILNSTRNYYRSWKSLGLELGIDSAALDTIERNYINDHRRLIAVIELWHSSVNLKPSHEVMAKALRSENVTLTAKGVDLHDKIPLLKDGDYECDKNVMVDGDVFTYPYYWVNGRVCLVKILQQITPTQNYFEYQITCSGVICAVTIGVGGHDYPLDRQPGWKKEGIGYHADNGKLYNERGSGERFGPTCTTGDRMGCGIDFQAEDEDSPDYVKVFFTKNGQQVGDFIKFKKPISGLYPLMGMNSRGEQLQYLGHRNYLPEQEKGYEEELNQLLTNEGHVELDISKVIITGAAGSGKTCTKLLLYKLPPPIQRQSTELIEPMDRAYIKEDIEDKAKEHDIRVKHDIAYHEESDSEYEWIVVEAGSETLYGMIAATVDSKEYKCWYKDECDQPERHAPMQEIVSTPARETFQPTKAESTPIAMSPIASHLLPMKKTTVKQNPTFERQYSEARRSLLLKLNNVDQKGVCVHKVRWLHLVDSGGQSRFHDILPTFLHHTSVIIYVLKLSETLDEQPFDDYYDDGQCVGDSRRAHYQVEQILKGVIQSAYYEKHIVESEKHTTKVLIVGTHKDQQTDKEDIDAKNSKLKQIFDPFVGFKRLEVLCHGDYYDEDIIFPLDAMKRNKESLSTGRDIRKHIINKGSKRVKVPISWFLLEEDIRSVGKKEKNCIVTISKCARLAEAVNVSQLKNALEYFHYLNVFLYFPHSSSLSNIIFTDPQIVVAIVSAFVKEAYQKVTDTEFKDFRKRGEFTTEFVKIKFRKFLVPDAGFEEAEVIELLKITLVVAHIEEGRYFMPCILPHCSLDEFEKERLN